MKKNLFYSGFFIAYVVLFLSFPCLAQNRTLAEIASELAPEFTEEGLRKAKEARLERRRQAQKIVENDDIILPDYWDVGENILDEYTNDKEEEIDGTQEDFIEEEILPAEEESFYDTQQDVLTEEFEESVDIQKTDDVTKEKAEACITGKPCSVCPVEKPIWIEGQCISLETELFQMEEMAQESIRPQRQKKNKRSRSKSNRKKR